MLTIISKIASGKHSLIQVFDDFMQMAICSFAYGWMEEQYADIAKKYEKHELSLFAELMAMMVNTYSERGFDGSWDDYLGNIFEELNGKTQSSKSGQFFTPPTLCNLMAKITWDQNDLGKDITVNDCAAGSSRNLIAHSRLHPRNRLHTFYVAQDIDPRCIKMSVLNYMMFGMRGVVIHMDALQLKIWGGYRIWLPETLMGVTPMSINECKQFLFEQKQKEKTEPAIVPVQCSKVNEQLSLFEI